MASEFRSESIIFYTVPIEFNGVCRQAVCSFVRMCVCHEMYATNTQILKTFRRTWLALITTAQNIHTYVCCKVHSPVNFHPNHDFTANKLNSFIVNLGLTINAFIKTLKMEGDN